MGEYIYEKVLRCPVDDEFDVYSLANHHKDIFGSGMPGKFQIAPTKKPFIDYVIASGWSHDTKEYGRSRTLTENEMEHFAPLWWKLFPEVDMSKIRLVEYAWNRRTDAADHYDSDNFYDDLTGKPMTPKQQQDYQQPQLYAMELVFAVDATNKTVKELLNETMPNSPVPVVKNAATVKLAQTVPFVPTRANLHQYEETVREGMAKANTDIETVAVRFLHYNYIYPMEPEQDQTEGT